MGRRNCPYEPAMMVKILLYAYATGTFLVAHDGPQAGRRRGLPGPRRRQLPAAPHLGRIPSFATWLDFAHLFREVVQLARGTGGWSELEALAIDRQQGPRQRLQAQSHELWADAAGGGAAADRDRHAAGAGRSRRCGRGTTASAPTGGGFERSGELQRRHDRLAAIRAAKARLEAKQRQADDDRGPPTGAKDRNPRGGQPYTRRYGAPDPKAQANFTDPESSIMKTSTDGFQQCYNAQIAVDGTQQLIVAADLSAHPSDQGQLHAVLDQVEGARQAAPADRAG